MSSNAGTARILDTGNGRPVVDLKVAESHRNYYSRVSDAVHFVEAGGSIQIPTDELAAFADEVEAMSELRGGFQAFKNFRKRVRLAVELLEASEVER